MKEKWPALVGHPTIVTERIGPILCFQLHNFRHLEGPSTEGTIRMLNWPSSILNVPKGTFVPPYDQIPAATSEFALANKASWQVAGGE